ncbi:MAG: DRTGG domain-containing protein [Acutalibacteraceae bacterium]|nr:DRTGG domain-containing protein [Acutalibacteraceae bacterium]
MKIEDIKNILEAEVICCADMLQREVKTACGSDMMSDVLAFVKEQAALLTGLVNPQVVRTAEMMDMHCIIFVRGKRPTLDMIEMAEDRDMVMLCTELEMFTACGKLYGGGLKGGSGK